MVTKRADSLRLVFGLFIAPLAKQKTALIWLFSSLVILGASQSMILFCLGPMLKVLLGPGLHEQVVLLGELLPGRVREMVPVLAATGVAPETLISLVPGAIFLAGLLRSLSLYIYQLNTAVIALFMTRQYRDRFFKALLSRSYLYISSKSPAGWMSCLMNDVLYLQTRFTDILNSFVRDGVIMVSAMLTLVAIYWPVALILMVVSPFVAFGMGRTGKRIAFFAEAFQKELAKMAEHILEVRQRFDFIKSQKGEKRESARWRRMNQAYYRMIRRSIFVRASFAPVMEWLGFSLFALILFLFSEGLLGSEFEGENLILLLGALGLLLRPLRNVGEQVAKFQETRGSLHKSLAVFLETSQAPDEAASGKPSLPAHQEKSSLSLKIRHMSASYGDQAAIEVRDLDIHPGRCIALVGPSGSGKSTLLKTLAGLIAPRSWQANVSVDEWTSSGSMVGQEPFLFEDSLRNNLTYGHPDQEAVSDGDLRQVLDESCVLDEVQALPGGLDHQVRAVQRNLSGGQIQRLVIGRALLRPASVWYLDEATAAVDAEAETRLLKNLMEACHSGSKTLLAVTHRLGSLPDFDEVWFIEHGRLQAKGSHHDLMTDKRYREFYGAADLH